MTRATTALLILLVTACSALEVASSSSTTIPTTTTSSTTTLPATTTTLPTLSGALVGPGGRPVVGAEVTLGEITTHTDAGGRFTITVSGEGPVRAAKPGWATLEIEWEPGTTVVGAVMQPVTIRGLRVGAAAAGDDAHFQHLLDIAATTAVNALVFDTKQEGGQVLYDTAVTTAHEIGAVDPWYDPATRLAAAKEAGLYTITRVVSFEDAIWVAAHPEEKLAGPWADPRAAGIRRYVIDLAKEACSLGFDEVQFDYVRFPAGRTAQVSGQLDLPQADRVAAIESFLAEARAELQPMGCAVSAAIFGIVVSTGDDQGLGQRPEELSRHLDALSPMIYPSHYSLGWLGYPDPNDFPSEVTGNAIDAAVPRLDSAAALRPWLQGFWWTNSQIRESIQAAEERGVGWVLWNVGSQFDVEALPTDDDVPG